MWLRPTRRLAVVAVASVAALVGCGGRDADRAGGATNGSLDVATPAATRTPGASAAGDPTTGSTPSGSPGAPASPAGSWPDPGPTPSPAPLDMPDLAVFDGLLADLDAALGADATADTDEGSVR